MIDVSFLIGQTDQGKQQAQAVEVATKLADFITAATATLDIAIYDFRLNDQPADLVINALNEAAKRGVAVRVGYFQQPAKEGRTTEHFAAIGADPAPPGTKKFVSHLSRDVATKGIAALDPDVSSEAIDGMSHLMHDKYIVRDGKTLWTGSTNFTNDAFSRQENNIVVIDGAADLCAFYENDFNEMWQKESISNSGKDDTGEVKVGDSTVDVAFSPGQGRTIDHDIATLIGAAKQEVVIATMVLSSAGILGALIDALDRGVALSGIYDATQMKGVVRDWQKSSAASQSKIGVWQTVASHLVGKNSTPYSPTGAHDFMHNKLAVIDGASVITGSFNFSNNATRNAENVVIIDDAAIAGKYHDYVAQLVEIYRDQSAPAGH